MIQVVVLGPFVATESTVDRAALVSTPVQVRICPYGKGGGGGGTQLLRALSSCVACLKSCSQ